MEDSIAANTNSTTYLQTIHCAPTEPTELKALGESSLFPEYLGADYTANTPHGMAGIQRKQFPDDFFASIYQSDRLHRELPIMLEKLTFPLLLLEGRPKYTSAGQLIHRGRPYTQSQLHALLFSIQLHHQIPIQWTADIAESAICIQAFFKYCAKIEHSGLDKRKPPKNGERAKDTAWLEHFWQGLPGVGPVAAKELVSAFENRLPFPFTDQLNRALVATVGPKKTLRIERIFQQ